MKMFYSITNSVVVKDLTPKEFISFFSSLQIIQIWSPGWIYNSKPTKNKLLVKKSRLVLVYAKFEMPAIK